MTENFVDYGWKSTKSSDNGQIWLDFARDFDKKLSTILDIGWFLSKMIYFGKKWFVILSKWC
jgi:hypothetical protein